MYLLHVSFCNALCNPSIVNDAMAAPPRGVGADIPTRSSRRHSSLHNQVGVYEQCRRHHTVVCDRARCLRHAAKCSRQRLRCVPCSWTPIQGDPTHQLPHIDNIIQRSSGCDRIANGSTATGMISQSHLQLSGVLGGGSSVSIQGGRYELASMSLSFFFRFGDGALVHNLSTLEITGASFALLLPALATSYFTVVLIYASTLPTAHWLLATPT